MQRRNAWNPAHSFASDACHPEPAKTAKDLALGDWSRLLEAVPGSLREVLRRLRDSG
ncbi:MAG: hypothetical protein AVDCRST_MAG42-1578 [uncultured Chthoniobacterales bacterium]|uniref:Uncharacterized protein n=1 Tax=uncultured Chthoniobacterales bacterium TaxID=1836801 RepID=A0A6J4I096_9BACT|nr:MAG: hypothetical protein AVDCRST_MAG42-1578 [uncultured Chthoniobacterales bacterium]